jgi:hypothetical protein
MYRFHPAMYSSPWGAAGISMPPATMGPFMPRAVAMPTVMASPHAPKRKTPYRREGPEEIFHEQDFRDLQMIINYFQRQFELYGIPIPDKIDRAKVYTGLDNYGREIPIQPKFSAIQNQSSADPNATPWFALGEGGYMREPDGMPDPKQTTKYANPRGIGAGTFGIVKNVFQFDPNPKAPWYEEAAGTAVVKTINLQAVRGRFGTEEALADLRGELIGNQLFGNYLGHTIRDTQNQGDKFQLVVNKQPGQDLKAYLEKNKLSPTEQMDLARQMIQIVKTIHQQGFMYRDLKAENFVYDPQSGKLSLIDFSTLRPRQIGPGGKEIPQFLKIRGTMDLMPPEYKQAGAQGAMAAPSTSALDIYTLGLILGQQVKPGDRTILNPG